MQLRNRQWRRHIGFKASRLPKMVDNFDTTDVWARQRSVLDADLRRMPRMNIPNVHRIVLRHAATAPACGYVQGNLYILYLIGLVFNDERSVFWAYSRLAQTQRRFGPDTAYGKLLIPDWVIPEEATDRALWDLMIRMRWLFVLFGQTFTARTDLLAIVDYSLRSSDHMFSLCAAMIQHGLKQIQESCQMERVAELFRMEFSDTRTTASLILLASQILQNKP